MNSETSSSSLEPKQFKKALSEEINDLCDSTPLDDELDEVVQKAKEAGTTCFVFDFDDTLVSTSNAQQEHPELAHDYTKISEHVLPIESTWDVLMNSAKPAGHVIILTGRDEPSTSAWLQANGRASYVDEIISCSHVPLDQLHKAKRQALKSIVTVHGSAIFVDNNDSNLMSASTVPGVKVMKISDVKGHHEASY